MYRRLWSKEDGRIGVGSKSEEGIGDVAGAGEQVRGVKARGHVSDNGMCYKAITFTSGSGLNGDFSNGTRTEEAGFCILKAVYILVPSHVPCITFGISAESRFQQGDFDFSLRYSWFPLPNTCRRYLIILWETNGRRGTFVE
ncbi:hypothetical protein ARMSODRAFT_294738 [Armillaria solidipes]|uniref:Uncharacterized protein n=1 Tax=Armillaria solidipes TaxID=1076256 RepID=A0A2H3AGL6_9AGAR|nr:hypothetical protein ARMSODRAFT_294738 [Armillaria solidipes]